MIAAIYAVNAVFIVGVLLMARDRQRDAGFHRVGLEWKRDAAIVLLCLLVVQASTTLHAQKELAFDGFEIGSVDSTRVEGLNALDRWAAGGWNTDLKDYGKAFKNTAAYLVPLSLLFFPGGLKRRVVLFVVYSQGYVLTESITGIAKGLTERRRPFSYIDPERIGQLDPDSREELLEDAAHYDLTNSFFSGDASVMVFGLSFFALALTASLGWRARLTKCVWIWAVVCSLLGAGLRVLSGKHFPTDVLVGALVGAAIAVAVLWVHRLDGTKPSASASDPGLRRVGAPSAGRT